MGMLHPAGGTESLTQRELRNDAATSREMVSFQFGGACFAQASREGWNRPELFDTRLYLWLVHNPGDRGLDPSGFTAAFGAGEYLLFDHPEISPLFHRDAVDRLNILSEEGPCCSSFGISSLFVPDREEAFYRRIRLCQAVLEETLTPHGDIRRRGEMWGNYRRTSPDSSRRNPRKQQPHPHERRHHPLSRRGDFRPLSTRGNGHKRSIEEVFPEGTPVSFLDRTRVGGFDRNRALPTSFPISARSRSLGFFDLTAPARNRPLGFATKPYSTVSIGPWTSCGKSIKRPNLKMAPGPRFCLISRKT
jgi:hypothetical protein